MKHGWVRRSRSHVISDKLLLIVGSGRTEHGLEIFCLVNPLFLAFQVLLPVIFPFIAYIGRGISYGRLIEIELNYLKALPCPVNTMAIS